MAPLRLTPVPRVPRAPSGPPWAWLPFFIGLALSGGLRAEFDAERLERLDRPLQGEVIALAPDGHHVAYATYDQDRKLWLQIADLEAKVIRSTFLVQDKKPNVRSAVVDMRWPSAGRLVFLTNAGLVYGVDADGTRATLLWEPANGLSGTTQSLLGESLPLPRMLPPLAGDSTHVLLEGPAQSAKTGSSLYRINVTSGDTDMMWQDYYRTATRWPPAFSDDPPTFVQERYLYIGGRMLYDRQANPRLQYFIWPGESDRPFIYSKVGEDPWDLDPDDFYQSMPHDNFDTFLGQKKKGEFRITRKNYFEERSFPLAFDYDPNILYYATSMGRDTYAIYALNLATKARSEVLANQYFDLSRLEPNHPDGILVFDEFRHQLAGVRYTALKDRTAWRDPELASIQAGLDKAFPRQTVEVLQWTEDRSRVLARFSADGDPGGYGLVDTRSGEVTNLLNRAPWLQPDDLSVAEGFAFDAPGGRLTGYLTLPAAPKVRPAPLIIYCQGGLWDRTRPGFNAEAQMLANLGLVTMRLNYRGTAGYGREHLTSIRDGIDTFPPEDLVAAVNWIASKYPVDKQHVVVMGEGFGGYVALRALQTHPEIFCAGISINAPTNLNAWARQRPEQGINREYYETDFYSYVREFFVRTAKRRGDAKSEDAVGRPLLVVEDSTSLDATPFSTLLGRLGFGMKGARLERLAITGKFEGGTPTVRARIFARIDTFLNENLYEYATKIGELKVLDESGAPNAKAPAKK
jgi:pimeloyl-ACP methyl ester carboxylesterase